MRLSLPYPPSMNHYWRRAGRFIHISREGREYRRQLVEQLTREHVDKQLGRPAVRLTLSPPDRRRRDLDNVQKPLLDALQHAGAYDNQKLTTPGDGRFFVRVSGPLKVNRLRDAKK
jgi:crossover junction endodeoxyribonuclease RusA